jgi:hypothetical protein
MACMRLPEALHDAPPQPPVSLLSTIGGVNSRPLEPGVLAPIKA